MAKNNKGNKVGIIIAVIVALVLAGAAVWYFFGNGKATLEGVAPVENVAVNSACKDAGGDDDLCRFFSAEHDFTKVASKMVMTSDGHSMTMHYDGKGNTSAEGSDGSRFVVLNDVTYIYDAEASVWLRMPSGQSEIDSSMTVDTSIAERDFEEDDSTLIYDRIGEKSLDGIQVVGYNLYDDASKTNGTEVWFGKKDNKMYQMVHNSSEGNSDIRISYPAVTIAEPSPVRDLGL